MRTSYESDSGIGWRCRLRNWLLLKLAGSSPVLLNCKIELVDRTAAPVIVEGVGFYMAFCDIADVVDSLPEDTALRIRPVTAADDRPLPENVTPFPRLTA
jgi:hypothetical protein